MLKVDLSQLYQALNIYILRYPDFINQTCRQFFFKKKVDCFKRKNPFFEPKKRGFLSRSQFWRVLHHQKKNVFETKMSHFR